MLCVSLIFQSTRPVRGATTRRGQKRGRAPISIHAPRAGRDLRSLQRHVKARIFQSTRPVRGATSGEFLSSSGSTYFNPRAPCGARRVPEGLLPPNNDFNPRAPCGARRFCIFLDNVIFIFQSTRPVRGATTKGYGNSKNDYKFQSTRPVRGATSSLAITEIAEVISIHAPRAGRDKSLLSQKTSPQNFNPRAPCGARRIRDFYKYVRKIFQSTRPVRGATRPLYVRELPGRISTHAPRAGRDDGSNILIRLLCQFQSTRPVRGATSIRDPAESSSNISIHAPRAGRDRKSVQKFPEEFSLVCRIFAYLRTKTEKSALFLPRRVLFSIQKRCEPPAF